MKPLIPELRHLLPAVLSFILVCAPLLNAGAQVSTGELEKRLRSAKIIDANVGFLLTRHGDQILFDGTMTSDLGEQTKRSLAFSIASLIVHIDAGATRSVVTRFRNSTHPESYQDIVVTNKEVVGVDAGIEGKGKVLEKLHYVSVSDYESPATRAGKYVTFANQMLSEDNPYEAEHLFQDAVSLSPDSAATNSRIFEGLRLLALAFDNREDDPAAERTYRSITSLLEKNPSGLPLDGLRQMAKYYREHGDMPRAAQAASRIVELQRQKPAHERQRFANDLRLLAFCHLRQNKSKEAKVELEEALLFARNFQGESHPQVAAVMEDLGDCYATDGNTAQALNFYTEAKERYDRSIATKAKTHDLRVEYEIYRGAVGRLNDKIKKLGRAKSTG